MTANHSYEEILLRSSGCPHYYVYICGQCNGWYAKEEHPKAVDKDMSWMLENAADRIEALEKAMEGEET